MGEKRTLISSSILNIMPQPIRNVRWKLSQGEKFMIDTVRWNRPILEVLDQTLLPNQVAYRSCSSVTDIADCIRRLQVRGAPAIGVTAAYGMAIAAITSNNEPDPRAFIHRSAEILAETRPTAVNLFWAIARMTACYEKHGDDPVEPMIREAVRIHTEDLDSCRSIGRFGAALMPASGTILTHCNAGALATAGYGTALGVIRAAIESGKKLRVYADETRPVLQGARLTAWELLEDGIDTTLITDNMAAYLMSRGEIDAVITGADRIAANGDAANKIGTYGVALAARFHHIPFYIAAPWSTIDMTIGSGGEIRIEERDPAEVTHIGGIRIAPRDIKVRNPAFDVTPHDLIHAIVTDRGVALPPFTESLGRLACAYQSPA